MLIVPFSNNHSKVAFYFTENTPIPITGTPLATESDLTAAQRIFKEYTTVTIPKNDFKYVGTYADIPVYLVVTTLSKLQAPHLDKFHRYKLDQAPSHYAPLIKMCAQALS